MCVCVCARDRKILSLSCSSNEEHMLAKAVPGRRLLPVSPPSSEEEEKSGGTRKRCRETITPAGLAEKARPVEPRNIDPTNHLPPPL